MDSIWLIHYQQLLTELQLQGQIAKAEMKTLRTNAVSYL